MNTHESLEYFYHNRPAPMKPFAVVCEVSGTEQQRFDDVVTAIHFAIEYTKRYGVKFSVYETRLDGNYFNQPTLDFIR